MMQKSINHYFLFLFILSFQAINCISFAASVSIAENEITTNQQTKNKRFNKNSSRYKQAAEIASIYNTSSFIEPVDFIKPNLSYSRPRSPENRNAKNSSNGIYEDNLYQQGKGFIIENQDNELMQESLIAFSNTKQFLNETDFMLHNLTQSALTSLNLNQSSQNTLSDRRQKDKLYSSLNNHQSSAYSNQKQGNKNQSIYTEELSLYTFLKRIFNWRNFFVLIGIVIIYSTIKGTIKFFLLQKEKKRKRQRRHSRTSS